MPYEVIKAVAYQTMEDNQTNDHKIPDAILAEWIRNSLLRHVHDVLDAKLHSILKSVARQEAEKRYGPIPDNWIYIDAASGNFLFSPEGRGYSHMSTDLVPFPPQIKLLKEAGQEIDRIWAYLAELMPFTSADHEGNYFYSGSKIPKELDGYISSLLVTNLVYPKAKYTIQWHCLKSLKEPEKADTKSQERIINLINILDMFKLLGVV